MYDLSSAELDRLTRLALWRAARRAALSNEDRVDAVAGALARAAERYDPSRGIPFRTCALAEAHYAILHAQCEAIERREAPIEAADLLTYPDACDTYERRCMLAMLGRALSLLNERERQIVTWHYYDGLTLREIGERIGISQTRTFQLRAQALGHLRGLLAPHETLFDL